MTLPSPMTLYRGYEITRTARGFEWTDERGFKHDGAPGAPYATETEALDSVDRYKRNIARGTAPR